MITRCCRPPWRPSSAGARTQAWSLAFSCPLTDDDRHARLEVRVLCGCHSHVVLIVYLAAVSQRVLQWGSSRTQVVEINDHELLNITRTMLNLLLLPQFQPILLPKYIVELLALLVYGETCTDFSSGTRDAFHELLESVLRGLSLRLCMSNLRAVLGQATSKSAVCKAFKLRCGQLLSKLLMEDGGVQMTMEMLLSFVDEGNTQARVQVAMLVRKLEAARLSLAFRC